MKINDNFAINVLAKRAAIEAVKAQLRSQGVKVTLVRCAELHRMARAYLDANEAALLAQAAEKWRRMNDRAGNFVVTATPIRNTSG